MMVGKTILHYKILEKLGEGGMGVVYKAEDTKLKRDVAIKFLPSRIAANEEERERFKIEAQAAAALNHPNIATIFNIEESDDEMFIVMEFIEGQELKDIISKMPPVPPLGKGGIDSPPPLEKGDRGGFIPIDDVINYATQIAEGLQAAHKKGIVHRDIKSSNIMITEEGKVKIMDFGLAKVRGGTLVTKAGTTLGTAAYMSPEQARGDEVDHRSDIWSFGVVLYEMVTGQLPFKGDYEQAVIYAILNEEPEPVANYRTEIPSELTIIINRCLANNMEERFALTTELVKALNALRSPKDHAETFSLSTLWKNPRIAIPIALVLISLGVASTWWVRHNARVRRARHVLLPQIEALVDQMKGTERKQAWAAFELSQQAREIIPNDALLERLDPEYMRAVHIYSQPSGASVFAKAYADSGQAWRYFGNTPLDSVAFPVGFSRIRLEKNGYRAAYDAIWNSGWFSDTLRFAMADTSRVPPGMEWVSNATTWFDITAAPAGLHMPGLEQQPSVPVGDFFMDHYEVTNGEYKRFVEAGGYRNSVYWKQPFIKNERQLTWSEAMALFKDKTGQPSPATWEVGDFPKGQADYPVTGVSWYEAAAYAEFAGKSLPSIYHWDRVAFTWASPAIVPQSNLTGSGLQAVGQSNSMNRFGIFDLSGNAREWCFNQSSRGGRFILGGGWSDPVYAFNDAYAQSPFDRSETNGFRCIQYVDGDVDRAKLEQNIQLPFRNFMSEKPVSDATFQFFLRQYAYDKTPLHPVIESEMEGEDWIRQKITFNAAYGNERMMAYLFLPKKAKPPFQTVIYFPGSGAIHTRSSEELKLRWLNEFLPKSGRALMYPIYKSTYERGDALHSDYPNQSNFWKEHVIMWCQDFSRSIDYLETREDIDRERLAYYGVSWGGAMGGIIPAVEKRIKASVLLVAGLLFQPSLPEAEPVNFLPRITMPVLMLNGKYDFFFPYETSQLPFYQLLGTPMKDKKLFVYEGGHSVPHTELAKEMLAWLDQYLGPVTK
jgi:serine/threonine protein kinase/formylglycine-generating enzyme required for sulfatase activity/dienelactone hydrolase